MVKRKKPVDDEKGRPAGPAREVPPEEFARILDEYKQHEQDKTRPNVLPFWDEPER